MIYMKILKKGGVVEKRGEEETKSMPHAPVEKSRKFHTANNRYSFVKNRYRFVKNRYSFVKRKENRDAMEKNM
jgi:hypothetical protein